MAFWKQVLATLIVLACGIFIWLWFVPGADGVLRRIGVPDRVTAAITPAADTATVSGDGKAPAAGNRAASGQGGNRRGGGQGAPLVVALPVTIGRVNDRLNAIGSGEAYESVTVTPQVSGMLKEIRIASGDKVTEGQVIARLDEDEQVIARDQARVAVKSAAEKSQLYKNLKSAVSRIDAFDADIDMQTANLALETAELNLKRRDIVAPIGGIAGIITVNAGDNVNTTTTIVTLDDRSEILVDYWVPERFAPIVKVGQPVEATAIARPASVYNGVVEAIDNRIDEASRTLRIRARIDNSRDDLRAGMSFNVIMHFAGEPYGAVDPLSVQWDSGGAYVWRVKDGKAEKVSVRIIQRNPDSVLVEADLKEGDMVVTEGVQRVRAGIAVRIAGSEAQKPVISQ